MAWTEEARAAAAEARKAHAGQKEAFSKVGKFNISASKGSTKSSIKRAGKK